MRLLLILALPALAMCQCISEDDTTHKNDSAARIALYKGQQKFSIDVLKILNEYKNGQNLFFSPHSIYQSLLLAYFTSANETQKLLQKALYLPETQTKIETMQTYGSEKFFQNMRELNGSNDYIYNTANKMFLSKKISARECMAALLKEELEQIDYEASPSAALSHINAWVEKITKGNIQNLLPPEAVDSQTKLILANAAYFKGLWKSKFSKENTKENELFYISTSSIRHVDMMRQKGTFNHMISESLKAHILEMPYKGGDVSMIVILPRFEDNAIDKIIKSLTEESLKEILDFEALYPRPIEVEIPKFSVEESMDLSMVFKRLGVSEIFSNNTDFTELTGTNEDIHFDSAIHKAKVDIDEEGTVAAAATAIFSFRSSRPLEPTVFRANHPFVYIIFDKVSQNILFLGVYKNPGKKTFKRLRG